MDDQGLCVYPIGFGNGLHEGIVSLMIHAENPQSSIDDLHAIVHALNDLLGVVASGFGEWFQEGIVILMSMGFG